MRLTHLIEVLQRLLDEHGDLFVKHADGEPVCALTIQRVPPKRAGQSPPDPVVVID